MSYEKNLTNVKKLIRKLTFNSYITNYIEISNLLIAIRQY